MSNRVWSVLPWLGVLLGCYESRTLDRDPCTELLDQEFEIVGFPTLDFSRPGPPIVDGSDIDDEVRLDGSILDCHGYTDFVDGGDGLVGIDNAILPIVETFLSVVDYGEEIGRSSVRFSLSVIPRDRSDGLGCVDITMDDGRTVLRGTGHVGESGIIRAPLEGTWDPLVATERWQARNIHIRIDPDRRRAIVSGQQELDDWYRSMRSVIDVARVPNDELMRSLEFGWDIRNEAGECVIGSFGLEAVAR